MSNTEFSSTGSVKAGDLLAGKYRVERILGEGGMGVVLAATNEMLRQRVAIKLLRPGALENAEALGRFQREAQAAASLKSQHVARVVDVNTLPDGRPMMVMEMLEGKDLGDVIDGAASSPIPVATAVNYVLQACEAIAEAHAAGIVHRDLKPKNMFLTKTVDGRPLVKVLDFGISKVVEDASVPGGKMDLTKTTEVIGSPSYMSPEQLRSARYCDHRTDIWALGVILYELLTGRLPFYAHTVTELVLVVATEQERPVHLLRPDVPPALSQVITQCLAKSPDHRIQSVGELAHYLEPFAQAFEASAAERVRAVAMGSGKSLPSPAPSSNNVVSGPSSSARIHVPGSHGGTSVAWGQTQMDPPRNSANPAPVPAGGTRTGSSTGLVVGLALVGLVIVGGGGAAGAVYWMKKASASTVTGVQPAPSESVPLPPGRKDLPPIQSASPPATGTGTGIAAPPESSATPSALPSTRTSPPPKPTSTAKKPSGTNPSPDDLSNIGRR